MNELITLIKSKLAQVINEIYGIDINENELSLETPPKKELGDYAFPCFGLSKTLKKGPAQIGQEIIDFINKNKERFDIFSSLEIAGPYLNIKLGKSFLSQFFIENHSSLTDIKDKNNENKTIVIDYIGANVGKPLHIGHMCTPNQGQVFVKLFEKMGYKVIGDSHFGDWGGIFGKIIYSRKYTSITIVKYYLANNLNIELNKLRSYDLLQLFNIYGIELILTLYQLFHLGATDNGELSAGEAYVILMSKKEKGAMLEFKYLSGIGIDLTNIEEKKHHEENVELWKKFTAMSITETEKLLKRLNIKSTYNIGESFYEGLNLPRPNNEDYPHLTCDMNQIVAELIEKQIATKNEDGSVGVVFQEETKNPSCILQKRDGTHGYLASDLAAVKYRMQNWNPEKIIYFVDIRQQLHLKQVFEISKMAGWISSRHPELVSGSLKGQDNLNDSGIDPEGQSTELFHAANGFISLKDGAMSTRKGRIIKLDKLLDEAEERAKKIILEKRQDFTDEELNKISKIVGIGAIKYGYLSKNRTLDVIFDWDEFMTFEGNSGPYIQYAYVRAKQILEKSGTNLQKQKNCHSELVSESGKCKNPFNDSELNPESRIFDHDEEIDLAKELFNYKSILQETVNSYYPHILCNYTYNLTKKFNSFYNKVHILSEENEEKKKLKLQLVASFSEVLISSFDILGIEMPDKM